MRWSSIPWTIPLPCVDAVAKLPMWASKSSDKFSPWGKTRVSPWNGGRVVFEDYVVDQLGGGCLSKRIFSPCKVIFALEVFVEGVEGVLPGPPRLVGLRLPVPLRAVVGEGVSKEEG